jgi:hypothetical protein
MKMSKNKKVKDACQESENRERVEKVTQLVSAVHYKTQGDREEAILSFSRCALSISEIENLIIPMKSDYLAGQLNRPGFEPSPKIIGCIY